MDIQKKLLAEQLEKVAGSKLGKKIMNNQKPKNVEEFRQMVPLTTYADYEPYLSEQQEDALAMKPFLWCHSSGRGGFYKWIPYSKEFLDILVKRMLTGFILGSTTSKGEVNITRGQRFLAIAPPPPYVSGSVFKVFTQLFSCHVMPPQEMSETAEFQERIAKGFQMALKDGVDLILGIASILVRIGDAFSGETRSMKFSTYMLHPKVMLRLLRGWLNSKKEKRAILPMDIWQVKGIMTGGVDMLIYKDDIIRYWGRKPYEFYGSTESFLLALQSWNSEGMVFLPDTVFLEFIPYEELLKCQEDINYKPTTLLLNEVKEGESYEVVITQLYGMPLLRYRTRDLIEVTTLGDTDTSINFPHLVFKRRLDETINLGGLVWLDEKIIWQAIANSGIKYTEWSACKEYDRNQGFLRLYIELKEDREVTEIEELIDKQLKIIETTYRDIESYLNIKPLRVTILSAGTFQRYTDEKIKEGLDLAHLKPSHINALESAIERILQLSQSMKEGK